MEQVLLDSAASELQPHKVDILSLPFRGECTGGDGIDVTPLDSGKIIFLYDVKAHGTHVANRRSSVVAAYQEHLATQNGTSLHIHNIASSLNTSEYHQSEGPRIEAMLLQIDEQARSIDALRFGGYSGFLYKNDGNSHQELVSTREAGHESWFGVQETLSTKPVQIAYDPGDTLLLFSDGFKPEDAVFQTKIHDAYQEMGMEGVRTLAEAHKLSDDDDAMCIEITLS